MEKQSNLKDFVYTYDDSAAVSATYAHTQAVSLVVPVNIDYLEIQAININVRCFQSTDNKPVLGLRAFHQISFANFPGTPDVPLIKQSSQVGAPLIRTFRFGDGMTKFEVPLKTLITSTTAVLTVTVFWEIIPYFGVDAADTFVYDPLAAKTVAFSFTLFGRYKGND